MCDFNNLSDEEKLHYHNVNPSLIKFEITEGSAMVSES